MQSSSASKRPRGTWRRVATGVVAIVATACSRHARPVQPPAPVSSAPSPVVTTMPVLKIGVILSPGLSSTAKQYGDLLLEGIRVAANEHTATGKHRIDLIVRDDSGSATRSASTLRALEAEGVVAVIGPIIDGPFNAAANARTAQDLVMIAPATSGLLRTTNTYAMNREDTAGAVLLGRYAASLGKRTGVLYQAAGQNLRDVSAFTTALTAAGGAPPVLQTFPSGTTTFATQIRKLRDAQVEVLYVPVSMRDIPQIIPQLGYYGLDAVRILGGEAWAVDPLPRALTPAMLNGVTASTVLPRASRDVAWKQFETLYEETYKRSLTSPIAALGYDAAEMIIGAAPRGATNRGDIARNVARAEPLRGATGQLRIVPGAVSRTAFLVRFRNGAWEPLAFAGAK